MCKAMGYVVKLRRSECYLAPGWTHNTFTFSDLAVAYVFEGIREADRLKDALVQAGIEAELASRRVPTLPDDLRYFGERLAQHPNFISSAAERERRHEISKNYAA